ncbi:cilia- and flagella-associated protein 57-like [Sycon ciliatum]|uniref:cilia- and flagella-associated protein 57-like n=2 Tax=Sycon ciliatum TaxID=27933 RepID=UPI0031F6A71E
MAQAEITPRYAFGVRPDIPGSVVFSSDRSLVYSCGKNLVIYNTETLQQQLISYATAGGDVDGLSAVSISPSRRFLAVAEQGASSEAHALVTIWDLHTLRRRKVMQIKESQSPTVISMSFSADSKYLATQSSKPDWSLTLWNWEKPKSIATVKSSNITTAAVYQVLFNLVDNTLLSVVGDGILKVYRYSENALKVISGFKTEPTVMRCQHWVAEDKLLVGNDAGELLIFLKGELKQKLIFEMPLPETEELDGDGQRVHEPLEGDDALNARRIHALVSGSRHVYVSFNHSMQYLERSEDGRYERAGELALPLPKDTRLDSAHDIIQIVRAPSDDVIAAVTRGNQIYTVPSGFSGTLKGMGNNLTRLTPTFHSKAITGMSICVWKSLIATCSTDKSVILWDFESCQQELAIQSKEEAYSVALHPSGLYMLVGYADKLRLMGLQIDGMRECKAFTIRACRECVFSNGGQFFAAINGNLIQVFNTYTYDVVANFKGHSNKIRGLQWSPDDRTLISCGLDGGVYEWLIDEGKRNGECVTKGHHYSSLLYTSDLKNILVVAADSSIKEISAKTSEVQRSFKTIAPITQITAGHQGRMMFAGAANGTVLSLKCPLASAIEHNELIAHSGAVSKIALSNDGQHLFTAGEDGSLFFFKVQAGDSFGGSISRTQYSDDVLIPKNMLKDKDSALHDLNQRVDELQVENEYQLRLKTLAHNDVLMEMTEKFHKEMESLQKQLTAVTNEKSKMQKAYEKEKLSFLENKGQEFLEMETSNNMKLMDEYEKYEELQAKCQRLEETHEKKMKDLTQMNEAAQREIRLHYEAKLKEMHDELEHAEDLRSEMKRDFEEMKAQIEEDCDREILDDANMFETKMREAKEQNIKLAGEAGVMKKKVNSLAKEITEHKATIEKLQGERSKLQGVIKTLEKDIQGLKKEMLEREETISDKERQIVDIRKKNQELEKFKFVLDFKIKELKRQIEPRDATIARKESKINRMTAELSAYEKAYHAYKHEATGYKQKLESQEGEMLQQQEKIRVLGLLIKNLKKDLSDALGLIQYPKELKKSVITMGETYLPKDKKPEEVVQKPSMMSESENSAYVINCLERSNEALDKTLSKDRKIHREEKARILAENVQLIKEINELRGDLKSTRTRVHDLEVAAKSQRTLRLQQVAASASAVGMTAGSSSASLTALGASPVAGYGTAVSLPLGRQDNAGQQRVHTGTAGPDDVSELRQVIEQQKEELTALRVKYRAALSGQRATVVNFPMIRSTSVTGQ